MPIIVKKSDGTDLLTITDGQVDQSTSVSLFGRGALISAKQISENFLRLMEHSAHTDPPTNPVKGEMWFDSNLGLIKFWTGTVWRVLGSTFDGSAGTATANIDGEQIIIFLANGRIIAALAKNVHDYDVLPDTVRINGAYFAFQSRFEEGILPGFNLASGQTEYLYYGDPVLPEIVDEGVYNTITVDDSGVVISARSRNVIPRGSIIMWAGPVSQIPIGYALCDGQVLYCDDGSMIKTPDMRNRFVMGAYTFEPNTVFGSLAQNGTENNIYALAFIMKYADTEKIIAASGSTRGAPGGVGLPVANTQITIGTYTDADGNTVVQTVTIGSKDLSPAVPTLSNTTYLANAVGNFSRFPWMTNATLTSAMTAFYANGAYANVAAAINTALVSANTTASLANASALTTFTPAFNGLPLLNPTTYIPQ